MIQLTLATIEATASLAETLAGLAETGDVILLQGDLGVGKTAFCRAFIQSLQQEPEPVPSPTFTLVQIFQGRDFPLWHFDLYRLKKKAEILELGLEEAFDTGVSLIEWPELVKGMLPENSLCITLTYGVDKESRVATLQGTGTWGRRLQQVKVGYAQT